MDRKHFPEFYRTNVKRIYRFLYFRVGGRKEVSEDLTQDVFVKALAAFESYDPTVSEASWIFTIARNHLINYIQKQKPEIDLEEIQDTWTGGADWAGLMSLRNDEQRLFAALEAIPSDDARLIRMKHLEGWSFDEIAGITGKNSGALRVQAHRALKAMRKVLKHK